MKLYERLAQDLSSLIRSGALAPGDRVPSVREISRERHVSVATVLHAYELLLEQGYIETRPRSGYYVAGAWREALRRAHALPQITRPAMRSTRIDVSELIFEVLESLSDRAVVPFGSAFPSPLLFPLKKLAASLGHSARGMDPWATLDDLPAGTEELRRQIARRYLRAGAYVSPDEIIITNGALEALNLSLQALTRPGDLVAIESPAFYGCLQAVEALGLKAIEIPTHPAAGIDLASLATVLTRHPVKACWLMTTFQNPLGASMSDAARQDLVRLLDKHDVPLIEDDVYAELYFQRRPKSTKEFDRRGMVLNCGSFSKSLAPGYRIGWVAAGRFAQRVARRKMMSSLSASIPAQRALALYLRQGGYDRHLAAVRRALAAQKTALISALHAHLPPEARLTQPEGGYFLWVELPRPVVAIDLHRAALEHGFSVAPGPIFSARRQYENCLRLNYGHAWSAQAERAVRSLSALIRTARGSHSAAAASTSG